jgi:hypothetical protein
MGKPASDLRRSLRVIRQYGILVGITAAVGLLAGAAAAALSPVMVTSTALVVLPHAGPSAAAVARGEPDPFTATQEVIAGSDQVLSGALPDIPPAMTLTGLRHDIQITSLAQYIISVNAKGTTVRDAEAAANAVARSYIQYTRSASSPAGRVPAVMLEPAPSATRTAPLMRLLDGAMLGTVSGVLTGIIAAVAGRRLTLDRLSWGRALNRQTTLIAATVVPPHARSSSLAHQSDCSVRPRQASRHTGSGVYRRILALKVCASADHRT